MRFHRCSFKPHALFSSYEHSIKLPLETEKTLQAPYHLHQRNKLKYRTPNNDNISVSGRESTQHPHAAGKLQKEMCTPCGIFGITITSNKHVEVRTFHVNTHTSCLVYCEHDWNEKYWISDITTSVLCVLSCQPFLYPDHISLQVWDSRVWNKLLSLIPYRRMDTSFRAVSINTPSLGRTRPCRSLRIR